MSKRVALQTLGCRLNQYETDAIATDFRRAGYQIVSFDDDADCYVVNTCTVTDRSDRKSRNLINRASRGRTGIDNASPVVVVTGCYSEANTSHAQAQKGVTYVVGNSHKYTIFDLVDAHFRDEMVDPADRAADRFGHGDGLEGFHTRAMLKIQDGCDNFCTFCIIPYVRGRAESRPQSQILAHAKRVIGLGAKEIVLTGVNIGRYDDDGIGFPALVESILELPGDFRVRLSSTEPDIHGEGFPELAAHEKFCPHLHLCLQSGSDRILLAMRRQYDVSGYLDLVEAVRKRNPTVNFTTDVIVGFPGETDEDFLATSNVIEAVGYSHVHTFPYSVRSGTKAARISGHVDGATKARRAEQVRTIAARLKRARRHSLVGSRQRLLVERCEPFGSEWLAKGHGAHYDPIEVVGTQLSANQFVEVEINGVSEDSDLTLRAQALQ